MRHSNTVKRAIFACKTFLTCAALALAVFSPVSASSFDADEVSWRQTVSVYQRVPCLTTEQLAYGKEVLRGLPYNGQRLFRKICLIPCLSFEKIQEIWSILLRHQFTYEQVLCFETFSELGELTVDHAIRGLAEVGTLDFQAGKSFRSFTSLPDVTPEIALSLGSMFNSMRDANNLAVQSLCSIDDITATQALDSLLIVARLVSNQARAADSFARITGMTSETMLDALPLFLQLRQDDAWNARCLFADDRLTRELAWSWMTSYFALPAPIQEKQYRKFTDQQKDELLQGLYNGGELLLWKINNLHAVTDKFGLELSAWTLQRSSSKRLQQLFERLSAKTRARHSSHFYPALSAADKNRMIQVLRQATAADRHQVAADLTTANIYALLARGSELYDSSFRDILVPILQKRIRTAYRDDLLFFLQNTDPQSRMVSDFIVSCAQKGKLATFFPGDAAKQKNILDLVAASAFRDEDAILLFSASFLHLLKVLETDSRSYLIETMGANADSLEPSRAMLLNVILQYFLKEHSELLSSSDRALIARLTIRHGAVDLNQYQATPFLDWKVDDRLNSVSFYHPDDDGRQSFISNGKLLLKSGYKPVISNLYRPATLTTNKRQAIIQSIRAIDKQQGKGLSTLFSRLLSGRCGMAFVKNINGTIITHTQLVYSDKRNQQHMLQLYIDSGDEMLAQRGHSYWRAEQLIEPLNELISQGVVSPEKLEGVQRFLSLGSCGGVKAYTRLTRMFLHRVDILATIGTGLAQVNDPYNKHLFEVVANNTGTITWQQVTDNMEFIFAKGRGQDYLQPGSLTAILHKLLDEKAKNSARDRAETEIDHTRG